MTPYLPPNAARCRPAKACPDVGTCGRALSPMPLTGAWSLQDYSLSRAAGVDCEGYIPVSQCVLPKQQQPAVKPWPKE